MYCDFLLDGKSTIIFGHFLIFFFLLINNSWKRMEIVRRIMMRK
jgi:hypothetical protein